MFARESHSALAAVAVTMLAVMVWAAVAAPASAQAVQRVDDQWHDAMAAWERPSLVLVAQLLGLVGSAWVTVPLRVLVALWLWRRKLWTGLCVWVLAVVSAQAATLLGKALYDRPRPDDGLVELVSASFPSGHSTNATVIALTLVFVFVPPGSRRWRWIVLAVGYALVMALSRNYLRVHWLSDVIGGVLSGTGFALWSALLAPRLVESRHTSRGSERYERR